ncbi:MULTISPECIES: ArsR family transcriptional regulator [unclassified Rhizobium]|uniref:ArsR/SmtB family transcription factor n=1 Tax=Rhizobium TaxID=379 RepID=UPI00084CC29C|nr:MULTISPECIES: ArsR family transcriptional regulator [unclassified Rhizobium]MCZ3376324.1 helix-turn-helix domain-containing protein [Rhizobium sp. AG207R]OEC95446.1 ArsR family transcriptional regulator [Rhizobium sp. YK2]QYA15057.1 helix-turn-helix domain-containing protein [Rhizobium sp. AB2/73]TWB14712.1 ArsR family transcriptional regulator [Rhizobium sp. ERR1071]TWB57589.1 ArsR family transcriptional regulator [Rhizobium sp. ERR 922]
MKRGFLTIYAGENAAVFRALSAPARVDMLKLLCARGSLNVNEIARELDLPQSTVATGIMILEEAGLVETKAAKARKGYQKICTALYDEILLSFEDQAFKHDEDVIEVAMPIGLYTSCETHAPCGLCSTEGVIGLLDVPDYFLDPQRMQAGLLWFGRGHVEYKFPNNAKILNRNVNAIEFSMELSSEVPGTNPDWPSDITVWINGVAVGTWTSPGDYGDKRGAFTPSWWKLEGSQYGKLKTWRISKKGTFIDGVASSDVTIDDLAISQHSSIRLRIGIADDARNTGGINIFGRGFGNYGRDILMRIDLAQ